METEYIMLFSAQSDDGFWGEWAMVKFETRGVEVPDVSVLTLDDLLVDSTVLNELTISCVTTKFDHQSDKITYVKLGISNLVDKQPNTEIPDWFTFKYVAYLTDWYTATFNTLEKQLLTPDSPYYIWCQLHGEEGIALRKIDGEWREVTLKIEGKKYCIGEVKTRKLVPHVITHIDNTKFGEFIIELEHSTDGEGQYSYAISRDPVEPDNYKVAKMITRNSFVIPDVESNKPYYIWCKAFVKGGSINTIDEPIKIVSGIGRAPEPFTAEEITLIAPTRLHVKWKEAINAKEYYVAVTYDDVEPPENSSKWISTGTDLQITFNNLIYNTEKYYVWIKAKFEDYLVNRYEFTVPETEMIHHLTKFNYNKLSAVHNQIVFDTPLNVEHGDFIVITAREVTNSSFGYIKYSFARNTHISETRLSQFTETHSICTVFTHGNRYDNFTGLDTTNPAGEIEVLSVTVYRIESSLPPILNITG